MSSNYTHKPTATTKHPVDLTADGQSWNEAQPKVDGHQAEPNAERHNENPIPQRGTPSTQTPEEFYAELTQREDVQAILRELAKQ